jgi:hypothetical protein
MAVVVAVPVNKPSGIRNYDPTVPQEMEDFLGNTIVVGDYVLYADGWANNSAQMLLCRVKSFGSVKEAKGRAQTIKLEYIESSRHVNSISSMNTGVSTKLTFNVVKIKLPSAQEIF